MRPVALGRKNWLHIGSPLAGPKGAAILSVVESCRRLKVSVRDYFSPDQMPPGLYSLCVGRPAFIKTQAAGVFRPSLGLYPSLQSWF